MEFTRHIKHLADQVVHHKKKHEQLQGRLESMTERAVQLVEVGAGAWAGGVLEGRTGQGTFLHVPLNLGVGLGLAAASALDLAGDWSPHLGNLGDGFIASFASSAGFNFGNRWRQTGKLFGGAPAPLPPVAVAPPLPPPVAGMPDPAAMAHLAQAMRG